MKRALSRFETTNNRANERLTLIFQRLANLDTATICDADKSLKSKHDYVGIKLMNETMVARNMISCKNGSKKILGVARTVQLTKADDFLAVLQGLDEAQPGEVLCVNTKGSTKAVAGGLFCREAERKKLNGIIVDGPIRDISSIQQSGILCFSTLVTPYSGTTKALGKIQVDKINCGGVEVSPGDVVFGDSDGIIVATIDTVEALIDTAENIATVEHKLFLGMKEGGKSLHSMTNFKEHVEKLKNGNDSSLEFTV